MYNAKISAPYSEILFKSFIPEEKKTRRFEYTVRKVKKEIVFNIKAKDAVALRAALNSIAKLVTVYEKAKKV